MAFFHKSINKSSILNKKCLPSNFWLQQNLKHNISNFQQDHSEVKNPNLPTLPKISQNGPFHV